MSIASLYPSINPSLLLDFANSKVLDPRITFTRTTTATYYDGVTTAKAEENLLVDSQEFNNWSKYNSTVTSNTSTAPDGTTTADTLVDNSTNSWHIVERTGPAVAGVYTYSAYIKAGTLGFGCVTVLTDTQANGYGVVINLSTGAVTSTLTYFSPVGASYTVTSVGSGWYRVAITITNTSGLVQVYVATSNSGTPSSNLALPTYVGSGGTILMWGAQLEQRSSATAYTATTTQAITNYIPVLQTAAAGQARFDHNPTTGESLGLLIEEARTNLVTYSAQFDNAAWTKSASTITANSNVAPDGTLSADTAVEDTATSSHSVLQTPITVTSSTAYTLSAYCKAAGRNWVQLADNGGSGANAYFNLSAGVTGTVSGSATAAITSVGNGWYRCSISFTTTGAQTGVNAQIRIASADATNSYTGNGFSGLFIWGAQLEVGSFATSYIPTVASSVTRNADAASMTGTNFSSWFNNGEGTLYADFTVKQLGIIADITVSSVNTNCAQLIARPSGGSAFDVFSNGALQATIGSGVLSGKIAGGYKVNDFAVSLNGAAAATDTSGTVANGPTQLKIGSRYDDLYYPNGTYKKFAYYPIKATSTQLQALTV